MNKHVQLLLLLLLPFTLPAQWTPVQTGSNAFLESAFAVDQNTWFIGGSDVTMRSTNAGATWSIFPLTADGIPLLGSIVTELHFFSANSGVATGFFSLGNDEWVLRTANGAQNWTIAFEGDSGPYPRYCNDLFFQDNIEGWAVGANGHLLHTQNSGATWSLLSLPGVAWELYSIGFSTAQNGFIGGTGGLLRTTNGGTTWTSTAIQEAVTAIQFLNAQTGFISGYNSLKKTTDGGQTWTDVSMPPDGAGVEDIWFADELNGYLLNYDAVYRTTDGGQVWEKYTGGTATNVQYNGFAWLGQNHGMIVGDKGLCLKTDNGGGSDWAPIAGIAPGPNFVPCANLPQTLVNLTADVPAYTYEWFLNGNLFSTERNPQVTFPQPGTSYTVMLVAARGAGRDTATWDVQINAPPTLATPVFTVSQPEICRGNNTRLSTTNYLEGFGIWELSANGMKIDSNLYGYFERWVTPLETTTYRLHASLSDVCGTVESEAQVTIQVTPLPLYSEFAAIPEHPLVCEGDSTVILIPNSTAGATYQWQGGTGGQATGTGGTLSIPTGAVGYNAVFSFTVINGGCYRYFQNAATVTADLVHSVQNARLYTETTGNPIAITNYSTGAAFQWDLGAAAQPPTSTALSPVVQYTEPGLYPIRLIAANTVGCFDTSYATIEVFPDNLLPTDNTAVCASEPTEMQFINHYLIERILDTYTDASGNTYVTGYKYEPFSWWSSYNLFYNKYDPAGHLVWARYWSAYSHGNSPFDYYYQCIGTSIAADNEGNVYIGGSFAGKNMQVGGVPVFTDAFPGAENAFILKLNPAGTLLWSARYFGPGGTSIVAPTELVLENENRLTALISGRFLNVQTASQTIASDPNSPILLYAMRFDSTGTILQHVPLGKPLLFNSDVYADYNPDPGQWLTSRITRVAPRMQQQPNGDWVLSAFFRGKIQWDTIVMEPVRASNLNAFVLRLDNDFGVKKAFTTFSADDTYQDGTGFTNQLINLPFATDDAGNIYQSVSLGTDEYAWTPPGSIPIPEALIYLNDTVPAFGDRCHFLLKYDPDGQLWWSLRNGNAHFSHLAPQPDGSVVGMVNYGHVLGLNTLSGQKFGKTGLGQLDLALVHWSPDGDILNVIDLATTGYDHGNWLAATADGKLSAFYSQGGNFLQGDTAEIRLTVFDPAGLCPAVPLTIAGQPSDAPFCAGTSPQFVVSAIGNGIAFQWQQETGTVWGDLTESAAYQGVNTSKLRLNAAAAPGLDSEAYRCVLTDLAGNTDTTQVVRPVLLSAPDIVLQPQSITIQSNQTASFSAAAQNADAVYQWQVNYGNGWENVLNGLVFQYAQGPTLVVQPQGNTTLDGLSVRCCVQLPSTGCSICTDAATLGVVVDAGTSPVAALPSLTAFPNPATERVWLQWQQIPDSGASIIIRNALGQTVFSEKINVSYDTSLPVDVRSWAQGVYEVQLMYGANGGVRTRVFR
ncbi:MAG: hypothetical protein LCH81_12485 [Bacteroidetes bacterium]|nr:hypothetical protein [Bacteroidota bacterium]